MSALQESVGSIIQLIKVVHDYLQIAFDDGTILNIYNKYQYNADSVSALAGKKLISVTEADNRIVLEFEGSGELIVGLLDTDYNGPEALEIIPKNKPAIIWQ